MRRHLCIILSLSLLSISSPASADRLLELGGRGSFSLTSQSVIDNGRDPTYVRGWSAGPYVRLGLLSWLSVQGAALIFSKGAGSVDKVTNEPAGEKSLYYIEVPLTLRAGYDGVRPFDFHGFMGLGFGFNITSNTDETNFFDLGGIVGVGVSYQFTQWSITLDARYEHGFLDVYDGIAGLDQQNRAFSIGLGIGWIVKDSDDDGITDKSDQCPWEAEDKDRFEDTDGCPDKDNDEDGVLDKDDKCPLIHGRGENMDKVDENEDGCPDGDRDEDGIADHLDKCPDQKPTPDLPHPQLGCPYLYIEPLAPAVMNGSMGLGLHEIRLREPIDFTNKSDTLSLRHEAILDEVLMLLTYKGDGDKNDVFQNIRIMVRGHSSQSGKKKINDSLSEKRASQVYDYLVTEKGLAPNRVSKRGCGDLLLLQPKEPKSWKNRRVDLRIIPPGGVVGCRIQSLSRHGILLWDDSALNKIGKTVKETQEMNEKSALVLDEMASLLNNDAPSSVLMIRGSAKKWRVNNTVNYLKKRGVGEDRIRSARCTDDGMPELDFRLLPGDQAPAEGDVCTWQATVDQPAASDTEP